MVRAIHCISFREKSPLLHIFKIATWSDFIIIIIYSYWSVVWHHCVFCAEQRCHVTIREPKFTYCISLQKLTELFQSSKICRIPNLMSYLVTWFPIILVLTPQPNQLYSTGGQLGSQFDPHLFHLNQERALAKNLKLGKCRISEKQKSFKQFPKVTVQKFCLIVMNEWDGTLDGWQSWGNDLDKAKTFTENWDTKAPSVGTILAYLETTA